VGHLSWQNITAFYYPGTTLVNLGNPTVRVRLDAVGSGTLYVFSAAGLRLAGAALPGASAGITQYRARSLPAAGRVQVDALSSAGWKPYAASASPAVFSSSTGTVGVKLANGTRRAYRGSIYANRTSASRVTPVSVLPMESYLRAVVPAEMPASWHPNALRAQAVAARTYARYGLAHATRGQAWDTCDTTSCQMYSGLPAEHGTSDTAIAATAGQTLTSGGTPAFTQFGAADGGWTAAGSVSYLAAKRDPYDGAIPNGANSWTAAISVASIQARWPSIGTYQRLRIITRDGHGQWGGRVLRAAVDGSKGSVAVTGTAFRSAFGLRSEWFIPTGSGSAPAPVATPPVTPAAAPWAATRYTPYKGAVVKKGSKGSAVVVLQRGLRITADGSFGTKTRAALVAFQRKQHILASGVTNRLVWARLEKRDYPLVAYRRVTVRQGSTGPVVVVVQRALRLTADGTFGTTTTAAVKAVQRAAKLAQSGVVSGWTWVAIEKAMPR
jgi:SpoIID/LytB domain protein